MQTAEEILNSKLFVFDGLVKTEIAISAMEEYASLLVQNKEERIKQLEDGLRRFTEAHCQWEAGIISDNNCWGGDGSATYPTIYDKHYDEFIEVQSIRNEVTLLLTNK